MGGFVSRRELGLLDASESQSQFPSPPSITAVPKHFLPPELDPRSPSAGIDRTPIAVIAPQDTITDPRSPSAGIMRTPIVCLKPESGGASVATLPAVEHADPEPSCPNPVPQFPYLDNSEVSDDINVSEAVCPGDTKSTANSDCAGANSSVSYALSPSSNKLFGPASSPSPRSPLGPRNFMVPRDSSTPRKIIQRIQSAHVEKLRGGGDLVLMKRQQQLQSSCDKENLQ